MAAREMGGLSLADTKADGVEFLGYLDKLEFG
jgi:hypothetical protein